MIQSSLREAVNKLTIPVGLVCAEENSPGRAGLAAGGDLWIGDYAWLLFWPVDGSSAKAIRNACAEAENHLDQTMLPETAQPGTVVDGYAVLILPSEPDAEARAMARQVELSPRICRKHVVWSEDGKWDKRLGCVTLLALPDGPEQEQQEQGREQVDMDADGRLYPVLPAVQGELFERVRSNWKQAIKEDLAQAGLEDEP